MVALKEDRFGVLLQCVADLINYLVVDSVIFLKMRPKYSGTRV